MKIALITACLAGVAHSKMAALALKKEAKIRGHEIYVEEQGGHKIPVKISKEQIEPNPSIHASVFRMLYYHTEFWYFLSSFFRIYNFHV